MRVWLSQHGVALRDAGSRFVRDLLPTSLNVLVIGIALALPASVYVAVKNLSGLVRQVQAEPALTLFLALDSSPDDVAAIGQRLARHPAVAAARLVSRAEALQQLERTAGLSEVVKDLGRNPLPDAFIVTARTSEPGALEALRLEAAAWPKVDEAQLDAAWLSRVNAAIEVGRGLAAVLAGLLAAALTAVTFNTIRLQILTRQAEIEVSKLIGATNAFVRRPFLYHGALQGLAGGAIAWGIVAGSVTLLRRAVGPELLALGAMQPIRVLGLGEAIALVAGAATLGWLGAGLSVWAHLRRYR